jgi:predicted nucleic acid-binding protein
MTDFYLDTSAVTKRYVNEVGSPWVRSVSDLAAGNTCWISDLTRVELMAAIHGKSRTGQITIVEAQRAEAVFRNEVNTHFHLIPVTNAAILRAMQLVTLHPLRAYDAMQLATALEWQAQQSAYGPVSLIFLSADLSLNRVAAAEGLFVDDPNAHP